MLAVMMATCDCSLQVQAALHRVALTNADLLSRIKRLYRWGVCDVPLTTPHTVGTV